MNFSEFQLARAALLKEQPALLDCAETNLHRTLAHLAPPRTPALEAGQKVHRCHLASAWCARFGLPASLDKRALVSCGVRDSLARLCAHWAREDATVWLPADNYPVFHELARAAGARTQSFETLPAPRFPDAPPSGGLEVLLVTQPMKPLGRGLDAADTLALERWLAAHPKRRLVLDTVYTFSTSFHDATLRLFAGEQTILLHSLTKGWLSPRLFGTALVPAQDAEALTPLFRASPPSQESLAHARACLSVHAELPGAVAHALTRARTRMREAIPTLAEGPDVAEGYFTVVAQDWRTLRERLGVLALPASAFGSSREDLSVMSSLSFARP